ncbi:MAG: glycosyltransferase family 2 protein [Thermofilum sp.]|nr:glycosyltransferase family 2 protein [Thermofilum sp.]
MLAAAVALALLHFGTPLAYYAYLKAKWLGRPWGLRRDAGYRPKVTVIVPTYNEAKFVEKKLEDIARQSYPRELLEVVVVDSASSDGTAEIARRWAQRAPLKAVVVEEPERRGKACALNTALKHASGEIVVITDADSTWATEDTLERAVSWLADPQVGAVTCLKKPAGKGVAGVEEGYRDYYNTLRVAESKMWATPIFHGELAAFRRSLLETNGGFPTDLGADDSHTATLIALKGYRAIAPEDVWSVEAVPREYHRWRVRRAQHLIQHFARALPRLREAPPPFRKALLMEAWLHLANPWLLPAAALLLAAEAAKGSPPAIAMLALGILLLAYKPYRTWVAMQLYLIAAALRNLKTKEIAWEKEAK